MEESYTLGKFLYTIGGFFIAGLFVYFLSKLLKVKYEFWKFPKPKSAGLAALAAVFLSFGVVTFLIILNHNNSGNLSDSILNHRYSFQDVFAQLFIAIITILPIIWFMIKRKEPIESAGLSKQNLKASTLIALILLILPCAVRIWEFENTLNLGTGALIASLFFAFLQYAIIGFSEEFIFRGYLQSRLSVWLGKYPGWIIASIIMAMMHISIRIAWQGFSPFGALIASAQLIPISLLLGYVMLRTGNIMGPAILHTFANFLYL